jgi:ACR3 family arsenite transporter
MVPGMKAHSMWWALSQEAACVLAWRCPVFRWRELVAGAGVEQVNLSSRCCLGRSFGLASPATRPAKGRTPSGRNRQGQSTDAGHRGGPARTSDEGTVWCWSKGAGQTRVSRKPTHRGEEPTDRRPMSEIVSERQHELSSPDAPVIARLSFLDRFLPVWIVAAMALGIILGRAIPSLNRHLNAIQVTSGTSLPIFIGLLVMMYPVLAKVRYGQLGSVTADRRMLISSLVLNWLVGSAVMFALAWLLLPDQPAYRTGLIIVGLARCIAMVLIWNDLSGGDREAAAVLVALNSIFQIVAFALLGYFYLRTLPGWLGLSTVGIHLSVWRIAQTVLIFLGVPLVAGFATRTISERARGREWYETTLLPRLGPFALYGLLYTIVILFALQGHTITSKPADVARIAVPLLAYFAIKWFGPFALGRAIALPYERTATLAFTAAGNNFELAIAVAIGVFGVTSGEALAGVVGPLIEVPVLVALVYVALWARGRYYPATTNATGTGPR